MELEKIKRQSRLSWVGVSLLLILCGVLAVLQYRWIGEVASAERQRLREDLQSRLNLLRRNLNDQISAACYAYIPTASEIGRLGRDEAYLSQYRRRKESQDPVVRRSALAVPENGELILLFPDGAGDHFSRGDWPSEWRAMHDRLLVRLHGGPMSPNRPQASTLVEFPRFGTGKNNSRKQSGMDEQEWLLLELNQEFIGGTLIPAMLTRYLGETGKLDYEAEVVLDANRNISIYRSSTDRGDGITWTPDASITLLEISPTPPFSHGPADRPAAPPSPDRIPERPSSAPPDSVHGLWLLRIHHHAGSLEAIVVRARRRNLALSGGLLLLILATIASLVRFSRRAQSVAELQMNFVAGVSHELRTPLTVIRTAAYNLRGDLANQPGQVARYGALIQSESEKLSALVEQVLRYGNVRAGRILQERVPVAIEALIETSVQEARIELEHQELVVEKRIEPGLPLVLADEVAMKHALRNLLDNALKYGTQANRWIGIIASAPQNGGRSTVEIRIADRGPGIPPEELEHIFDSFFRGQRALRDQIHGTGLGLSLVKKIVEAHGGTVSVNNKQGEGVEFIVRIPAVPAELQNELTHSSR